MDMSVLSTITKLFPPPRFITLPSVGIDISDASIKYIRFARPRGHVRNLELAAWGDVELAEGVVGEGKVLNTAELTKQLTEVRKKAGVSYARMSLPEKHAYVFETEIKAGTSPSEIRGLLEFKLEENVPLSPRDAFFDYEIVERKKEENLLRVVVTVYGRETVQQYYEACSASGIMPLSFEVEAQAIARAITKQSSHGSSMIVDFGERHTGIGIVHSGTLVHTFTVDVGGATLSDAMRAVRRGCTEDELTQLKNKHGLQNTHTNQAVQLAIVKVIEKVADELEARIQYWNTAERARGEREVMEVLLCGGSSNLAGLPEYLSKILSVPVRRSEVWQNAFSLDECVPPITQRHAYGYATAIGLALADISAHTS